MKNKYWIILLSLVFAESLHAKKDLTRIADDIVCEGRTLYKIDMASWHGTDIFMSRFKGKKDRIGGYFSYLEDDRATCVFYSNDENHKILATISFDSTYNWGKAIVSDEERPFTVPERTLYEMRNTALKEMNSDSLFEVYEGIRLNLIPVIYQGERKVYIVSGPYDAGVVILGNDYVIEFDKNLKVKTKRKIHKSFIPIRNEKKENDLISAHSHLQETGDFITVTDVCTILQYQKTEKWKQHFVISQDYVSVWDCEKSSLLILTKEAFDKIAKH